MKVFNGNGCCTRCAQDSSQLTLRRVNKVKQMKNPSRPQNPTQSCLVPGCSLATIALRQIIFLLSFAIHTRAWAWAWAWSSTRLATVYFTAPFPWHSFFFMILFFLLLLAQPSVQCTTFSAIVKRIKSMRQQK